MQPKNYQFGGGAAGTILHPLVAVGILVAIVLILILPRNKAITPFLIAFLTIPLGQVLVLGGVHFLMHQVLILTVLARMAAFRGKGRFAGGFNTLDKLVVLWSLSAFIIFSLNWMQMQAVIKSAGELVVSLGGYLAVRFLIPDRSTVSRLIKALAVVCVIQGVFMVSEQFTHLNVFSAFGANPPTFREGHIRAEGAMGNLWAGALGGIVIPLFIWLWSEGRSSRIAACAGIAGATAMVFATYASTAWGAYGASLLGLAFWPLRNRMRLVRWGLVAVLVTLHLVMHGPVWSLIEKIDLTGGSSSYHRYMLVDNCIRHFGDWWLLGSKTFGDWGFVMYDLCNQFIVAALRGGLLTLLIYIGIYKQSFGVIGIARKRIQGDRRLEWFVWCLGSALFTTVVASFGINFSVHLLACFASLLVCVSVAMFEIKRAPVRRELVPAELESAPAGGTTDLLLGRTTEASWHRSPEAH